MRRLFTKGDGKGKTQQQTGVGQGGVGGHGVGIGQGNVIIQGGNNSGITGGTSSNDGRTFDLKVREILFFLSYTS